MLDCRMFKRNVTLLAISKLGVKQKYLVSTINVEEKHNIRQKQNVKKHHI